MTGAYRVRLANGPADAAKLKSIRHDIFVVEQRLPAGFDWDEIDGDCRHAIAEDAAGAAIGCGRLLPDGHIGRMAVRRKWRGQGAGGALLERLIELARELGYGQVMLNAQTHAVPFYARFGFTPRGPEYEEAGVAHQAMERELSKVRR